MSVSVGKRNKFHKRKKITKHGVDFWEYKFIKWDGTTGKRILTTKDYGNSISRQSGDMSDSMFAAPIDSGYSWGSAFKDNRIREHLFANSPDGAKIKEYYDNYGSQGEAGIPDRVELEEIKTNASEKDWELFVQYGLGVKEDKVDKWTKGSAAFDKLTTKTAEDIEEWAKSEDIDTWYDERTEATEGEPVELKSEEEITAEDPRRAQIDQWLSDEEITESQHEDFLEKLKGLEGTVDPNSIMGKEAAAREAYRDALTGQGGYEDTLAQLVSDKAEEMKTLGISKESSLDDILEGYMAQSDEYKDVYGQQISDITTEEDIMRSKTGLSREEEDISGLVKSYEDDYTKRIEDYRKQTGATQEEAIEGVRTAQTAYEEGIEEARSNLDFAFKDLEDAWGGGEGFGASFLSDLTEGYWGDLQTQIDDLYTSYSDEDIDSWYDLGN